MDEPSYPRLLRALAHGALEALPREPWLHRKRLLAEHAVDDLDSAAALEDLRVPAPPVLLPRASDAAGYEHLAYAEVKPRLAVAARQWLPAAGPEELRALIPLAIRQERHVEELPVPVLHHVVDRDPVLDFGGLDPAIAGTVKAAETAAARGAAREAAELLREAAALEAAALVS